MANDDWKYKELPKAAGETAPSVWNPKENKWEVYTGSTNVVELENKLETIEEQQKQILERLDGEFDTRLTGSNVEFKKILADKVIPSGSYVTLKNADDSHMRFMTQNVNIGVRWDSSIDWKVRILYVGEETTATIEETEV